MAQAAVPAGTEDRDAVSSGNVGSLNKCMTEGVGMCPAPLDHRKEVFSGVPEDGEDCVGKGSEPQQGCMPRSLSKGRLMWGMGMSSESWSLAIPALGGHSWPLSPMARPL